MNAEGRNEPKSSQRAGCVARAGTKSMPSHYANMGLQRDCTEAELKKQYRLLALKYHPDRNRGKEEWAAEKFKQLQEAHSVRARLATRVPASAHDVAPLACFLRFEGTSPSL